MLSKKSILTIRNIGVWISLVLCFWWFFYVNTENYRVHKTLQAERVNHPESLPWKEAAKFSSLWFKNLAADLYWIEAIQYIWSNALRSEYKKYLFAILDLITDLNPYFESPYIIGQLLLPEYNSRYEKLPTEQQENNIRQWETLWLKGIKNFCDPIKIEKILKEDNLLEITTDPSLKNPCKGYKAPYYLAYIYFFHLNNPLKASAYYKVVSAQDDSPQGAKLLAAIMQWKSGDREKSLFMFLNLAENRDNKDTVCKIMSQELQRVYTWLSQNTIKLDWKLIQAVEETRKKVFPPFSKDIEEEILGDGECTNFLNKWIRELNLLYIEKWNTQFEANHPTWLPARNAQALFEEWYIDFLPTDYQQYDDYGIIYAYDYERGRYDYEMGNY